MIYFLKTRCEMAFRTLLFNYELEIMNYELEKNQNGLSDMKVIPIYNS